MGSSDIIDVAGEVVDKLMTDERIPTKNDALTCLSIINTHIERSERKKYKSKKKMSEEARITCRENKAEEEELEEAAKQQERAEDNKYKAVLLKTCDATMKVVQIYYARDDEPDVERILEEVGFGVDNRKYER